MTTSRFSIYEVCVKKHEADTYAQPQQKTHHFQGHPLAIANPSALSTPLSTHIMSPHIHLLDFDHNVIIFVGQRGAGVRSFIARASGELEMPRYSTAVDIEESVNGAMRVKRYHLINDPSRPFGLAPHHRVRDHCVGIIAVYNNTATDSLDTALRELDTARIAVVQHSAVRRPPIVYLVANNRNLDDCTSANLVAPETGREAAESAGAVFAEVSCQRRRRSAVVPSLLRRITATLSTQPAVSPLGGGVRLPLCPPQPT